MNYPTIRGSTLKEEKSPLKKVEHNNQRTGDNNYDCFTESQTRTSKQHG